MPMLASPGRGVEGGRRGKLKTKRAKRERERETDGGERGEYVMSWHDGRLRHVRTQKNIISSQLSNSSLLLCFPPCLSPLVPRALPQLEV